MTIGSVAVAYLNDSNQCSFLEWETRDDLWGKSAQQLHCPDTGPPDVLAIEPTVLGH